MSVGVAVVGAQGLLDSSSTHRVANSPLLQACFGLLILTSLQPTPEAAGCLLDGPKRWHKHGAGAAWVGGCVLGGSRVAPPG